MQRQKIIGLILGVVVFFTLLLLPTPEAMTAPAWRMVVVVSPPNVIVFGYNYLSIKDMVRSGFWLNSRRLKSSLG